MVARNYNRKGQKGEKCAFKGPKVQAMIYKAVQKNRGYMEASDKVSEGAITEWRPMLQQTVLFHLSVVLPARAAIRIRERRLLSQRQRSLEIYT